MNALSALQAPAGPVALRSTRPALDVGNLPSEINAFVGRERELVRLRALQDECRLLTLVGPSGVGKTRLALRLAVEIADAFADGAWVVDLSLITDPALVPQAVGDVLGVRHPTGEAWLDALARTLRAHRLLVVLDNCEHLCGACADLVDSLLRRCPGLHVLATSLQPLDASGETTWRVPPLAVPAAGTTDVRELGDNEAVRLFVARARAHVPDFTLAESNAQLVAEVCRQLDGLPLALELVAARLESLGLGEVAVRLSDRFALARGEGRTRPARQRTLQAALDWSCSLLDLDELTLLRRLAVFVGGWTLEGAEAVCAIDELPGVGVADVLGRLVTKSLVVAEHVELRVRYRLLETVRAYALRQLAAAGETQSVRSQHAGFLLHLAQRAEPMSLDAAQAASLEPEEGNLRAALEWTLQYQHAEVGLRLATASYSMWQHAGHYSEASAWLERLLALPDSATAAAAHANALIAYAQVVLLLGNFGRAQTYAHAALEQHRAHGDARGIGLALKVLGNVALQQGDLTRAAALHTDALRRLEEAGSRVDVISLTQLVVVACELGDTVRARQLIAQVEEIGQARGSSYAHAGAILEKAMVAAIEGDTVAASGLLEQALLLARRTRDQQMLVIILTRLGHVRLDQRQRAAALAAFAEAVQLARASGERIRLVRALEGVARGLAETKADAAVRLAAATDSQRLSLGVVPWPSERRCLGEWLMQARRALGPSDYQRAWDDGHVATLEQAVGLAEALTGAESAASPSGLTSREEEVAALLARGLTNKQVAAALVVSPATVRSHVEHILIKLDLRSRAQVAVWATQHGLLPDPELE